MHNEPKCTESYMDIVLPATYVPPRNFKNLSGKELLYYLKYSRKQFDKKTRNINVYNCKMLHPIMQLVFKISRILSGVKVVQVNNKLPECPPNRPIIYTISHVGKDDQAVFNEIKTRHYTVLSGDYESLYNNIEGAFTKLNGVLFFDMNSREERKLIINRVIERLSCDDILCSMEGAWNISPNCLVYEIFPGMIKAALKSNAVIVPVGIERFNAKLYSLNVAEKCFDPLIEIQNFSDEKTFIEYAKEHIRQELACLKFDTYFDKRIERKIICKRSDLGDYEAYREWFVNDILSCWTFTEEDINRKRYRNPLEPANVFAKGILKE